jgi:phytoene synthase
MQLPSSDPPLASAADRLACKQLIRTGSRTFSAASLLLPSRIRDAAYALYGFCRLSDDLVDIQGGSMDAITRLRRRLDLAYAGRPAESAVDRAFADVVARFEVPRALPDALIDGLEWDVAGVRCEVLSDLYAYAARVAGSVGAMMSVLMGARSAEMVSRACDLGVAMQLTNVARDVGEDARAGRLYLPRSWLQAGGLDPEDWLARPRFDPVIGAAVERLLQEADKLYARADDAIASLPMGYRAGIFAARHLYREIGVAVSRRGFDSVSDRARVSDARKLGLAGRALFDAAVKPSSRIAAPPLAEAAYLVDAVVASAQRKTCAAKSDLGKVSERLMWVAELFASLDARARLPGDRL